MNLGWIDLHSHILPGIDDGAKNWSDSIKMLECCQKNGISTVILTPHYHYERGQASPQRIRTLTAELAEQAAQREIPIRLYPGNELFYTNNLLSAVKSGDVLTLADSDYVLLEFSISTEQRRIQNAVYEFLNAGYFPVLAHIERYAVFLRDPSFAEELLRMGAYFQVNAGSLQGNAGWKIKRFSQTMLKSGRIQLIGSDAHDPINRPPNLAMTAELLYKKMGLGAAEVYLQEYPRCIIENRSLPL